jgi:hypothetical protein
VERLLMKARPTTLGLMGVIAFVAVGLAALRTNDARWAAVTLGLTVFTLCTATLVAIDRRGAWAGFAVFGWAQFLICQPHAAPTFGPPSLSMGIAYRLLPYVNTAARMPKPSMQFEGSPAFSADGDGNPYLIFVSGTYTGGGWVPVNSLRAGLCLSSIMVGSIGALAGGSIARHSVARRDESAAGAQFRREVVS